MNDLRQTETDAGCQIPGVNGWDTPDAPPRRGGMAGDGPDAGMGCWFADTSGGGSTAVAAVHPRTACPSAAFSTQHTQRRRFSTIPLPTAAGGLHRPPWSPTGGVSLCSLDSLHLVGPEPTAAGGHDARRGARRGVSWAFPRVGRIQQRPTPPRFQRARGGGGRRQGPSQTPRKNNPPVT